MGPWLATTIWNDIVLLFCSGMPCKRHRIQMKFVERCFSGSEAVNWLHRNLKGDPRLVGDITKEKISLLLQKFLQTNIIEVVHSRLFSMPYSKSKECGDFRPTNFYRIVNSDHGEASKGSFRDMHKLTSTAETNPHTPGTSKNGGLKLIKSSTIAPADDAPDEQRYLATLQQIQRLSI